MKNLTKNMMIAAAALVVAAGAAQAQQLKAEIPFSFRAAGNVMPAGEYRVVPGHASGAPIFQLINADAHSSAFAMPYAGNPAPTDNAKLTFQCVGANCWLSQ